MSWSHGEDLAHGTSHFSRSEEMIWCVLVHAVGGVQERCGGGGDASSPERDGSNKVTSMIPHPLD